MGYILEMKTTQATAIKSLIETLQQLLTEVNFTFYPYHLEENDDDNKKKKKQETKDKRHGGLVIKTVKNTILVFARLEANKFEHYNYSYGKKKLTIGVNLTNFAKCLKVMNNYDSMTWAIDESDMDNLIITLVNSELKENKVVKLKLHDFEDESFEVDPVTFPYKIIMPTDKFYKYCKDMSIISDKMELICKNKKLYISANGEIGSMDFCLEESPGACGMSIIVNNDNNEIVQGLFELKFLLIFTKCTNLCTNVEIFLRNDYPLVVRYAVAALGEIKFVLAQSKPKDSYD